MELFILLVVSLVTVYISSGIINLKKVKQADGLIKKAVSAFPTEKNRIIYCVVMLIYQLALCFTFISFHQGNICEFSKTICLTSIMWPLAQIDIKQKRIPNKLLLLCLIYRVIILIFELIFFRKTIKTVLISEVVVLVAISLITILCMIIVKNGIGMGDLKLFMVMAVMLDAYGFLNAIMLSMIIAFFVALYLLIVKKKDKKYDFAFGPIVAIGTLISSFFIG